MKYINVSSMSIEVIAEQGKHWDQFMNNSDNQGGDQNGSMQIMCKKGHIFFSKFRVKWFRQIKIRQYK